MSRPLLIPALAFAFAPSLGGATGPAEPAREPTPARVSAAAPAVEGPLPWLGRFEENRGQAPAWARFVVRTSGYGAALTDSGAAFSLPGVDGSASRCAPLRFEVEGASPHGRLEADRVLPGVTHHLLGNDPEGWVRGTRAFGRVTRRDVRPGVDLVWTMRGGAPEYAFLLDPGTDPRTVVLRFEGAESLRVEPDGALAVTTRAGVLRHGRPSARQGRSGAGTAVSVAFEIRGPGRVGFRVGPRDSRLPLAIDPVISFASYYGGSGSASIVALGPSPDDSLLVVGSTQTAGLSLPGALDESVAKLDLFVAVLEPLGSSLRHATYVGGGENEAPSSAAVDADGCAWIAGYTHSPDFPVWLPSQGSLAGLRDAFVLRLRPGYDGFEFSTFFGGSSFAPGLDSTSTGATQLALTPGGGAFVVGTTSAVDLPLKDPFQPSYGGWYSDGFVSRFSASGELLSSSYLGGNEQDTPLSVAVDETGAGYVAGGTRSTDFPEVAAIPGLRGTSGEAFVAKISADGTVLERCQQFGGADSDEASSVAVLPDGDVVVGGKTSSTGFPIVAPLQSRPFSGGGGSCGFLSRFSAAGDALLFSSWIGGNDTRVRLVEAGPDGSVLATGTTRGFTVPLVSPIKSTITGNVDAFLLRLLPDSSGYEFSTYLGGDGIEDFPVFASEPGGRIWFGCSTTSGDIPVGPQFVGLLNPLGGSGWFLMLVSPTVGAPGVVVAQPMSGIRCRIRWLDETDDETGFEIQRRQGSGTFASVATVPANTVAAEDGFLLPLTDYGYRVRALRPTGPTAWSDEALTTTLDVVPLPPVGVTVAALSGSSVRVTWTPGSANADVFEIHRRFPGGTAFLRSVLPGGVTQFDDAGLPPGKTVGYVVRAANEIGATSSAEAWGATGGTIDATLSRGSVKSRLPAGRDAFTLVGTFAFGAGSPDAALDPISDGFSVRLGDGTAPRLELDILPASPGWSVRSGRFTWRSNRSSPVRALVEVRPLEGRFRVVVSRADFAGTVGTDSEVRIASGNDAAVFTPDWEETQPGSGSLRFPPRDP